MNNDERERLMLSKIRAEREHLARLKARGLDNLTIADRLIQLVLDTLEEGFRRRFPEEDDDSIRLRVRNHLFKSKNLRANSG